MKKAAAVFALLIISLTGPLPAFALVSGSLRNSAQIDMGCDQSTIDSGSGVVSIYSPNDHVNQFTIFSCGQAGTWLENAPNNFFPATSWELIERTDSVLNGNCDNTAGYDACLAMPGFVGTSKINFTGFFNITGSFFPVLTANVSDTLASPGNLYYLILLLGFPIVFFIIEHTKDVAPGGSGKYRREKLKGYKEPGRDAFEYGKEDINFLRGFGAIDRDFKPDRIEKERSNRNEF